jgi:hypothetical protein
VVQLPRRSGIKAGPPFHDDLIEQDFSATAPNQKRLTDITWHHTAESKLYLARSRTCIRMVSWVLMGPMSVRQIHAAIGRFAYNGVSIRPAVR